MTSPVIGQPSKALSPMLSRDSGNEIAVIFIQFLKASMPIRFSVDGKVSVSRFTPLNALSPISSSPSGKTISVNLEAPEKAPPPIRFKDEGNWMP